VIVDQKDKRQPALDTKSQAVSKTRQDKKEEENAKKAGLLMRKGEDDKQRISLVTRRST
jgi:hypothetical protein